MVLLFRSFSTRIDDHPAFGDMSGLTSRVERRLHAALHGGRRFTGDLAVSFYQQFGISAKQLDGIHRELKAKLRSISELAKVQANDLDHGIAAKRRQIAKIEKKLRKANGALARLRHNLHQLKRRLGILETRLGQAKKRISDPSICFGTRRLFNAQHHLEDNGYADHAAWLKDWKAARSGQFFVEGDARAASGNNFVRLSPRDDGMFDIELRLPKALARHAQHEDKRGGSLVRWIEMKNIGFPHGAAEIREALLSKRPISYRFESRDDGTWTVAVIIRQEFAEGKGYLGSGALGVDLNAGHIALTLADASGNPVESENIDLVTYGKTTNQRLDTIRKAAAAVAKRALDLGIPVVAEKLDFARKRAELGAVDGQR